MEEFSEGTIEYFVVDVTDRLNNLTTLDGYDLTFDVKRKDSLEANKYTNEPATNDGMKILCLIDTTDWDHDTYNLWTKIIATPESPRLGPFEFLIVD